ncbi:MAG: hypothetical protein IT310_07385 [Anaerolineales bacterium]|nr:hypothetical protein [Anaerolineales bacterium]
MIVSTKKALLLIVVMLLTGCQNNTRALPDYISKISIPNWDEIYPLLRSEAQKWEAGAELNLAVLIIDINEDSDLPLVRAIFESPDNRLEFLYIEFFENQTFHTKTEKNLIPILDSNLVFDEDWKLNSNDVWKLFLENEEVVSASEEYFKCSTLTLINKEVGGRDEKKVVWQLALDNCLGTSTLYFIDAKTSQFLGSESH